MKHEVDEVIPSAQRQERYNTTMHVFDSSDGDSPLEHLLSGTKGSTESIESAQGGLFMQSCVDGIQEVENENTKIQMQYSSDVFGPVSPFKHALSKAKSMNTNSRPDAGIMSMQSQSSGPQVIEKQNNRVQKQTSRSFRSPFIAPKGLLSRASSCIGSGEAVKGDAPTESLHSQRGGLHTLEEDTCDTYDDIPVQIQYSNSQPSGGLRHAKGGRNSSEAIEGLARNASMLSQVDGLEKAGRMLSPIMSRASQILKRETETDEAAYTPGALPYQVDNSIPRHVHASILKACSTTF